ncbi:hypothetical protein K458DRAFT_423309 [Lentithecium fluviatile CBS 122367]|uniref:Uncharacterized protein n=1 Tax=Lentithecium fluviatile CBS 122367 TaxID=1168545 RepID=A0A6G1IJR1_9PLEO|nr:hypothetical protein K458DRAFT_423309 [Lentithecium fluviatile CBS 122367]
MRGSTEDRNPSTRSWHESYFAHAVRPQPEAHTPRWTHYHGLATTRDARAPLRSWHSTYERV